MWMIKQNNNLLMTNPRPHLGSQKSWGPQLEESCTILADSYFHLRLPFYRMRETLRMVEMMNGEKDCWLQLFLLSFVVQRKLWRKDEICLVYVNIQILAYMWAGCCCGTLACNGFFKLRNIRFMRIN